MDWITGIQNAIDYVEDNILNHIDYEEVARKAYSSSFHFQRVFSLLCGYTLGDYIRLRRLTLAGAELASKNVKVIDVALKYGYDSPESFSRAFVRFHGVTPSSVKNGESIKSFSRISVKLTLDGGDIMDYRIEKKEEFKIICKKKSFIDKNKFTEVEIREFWNECMMDGTIQKLIKYGAEDNIFGNAIVGVSFARDERDEVAPYGIGIPYNGQEITDEDLVVETIQSYTYVILKCVGEMPEAFEKTYKQVYSEFFPTSGYSPCNGVAFEVYPSADVNDPDYTCEIWITVEKK